VGRGEEVEGEEVEGGHDEVCGDGEEDGEGEFKFKFLHDCSNAARVDSYEMASEGEA
jgi:hypothetical protein